MPLLPSQSVALDAIPLASGVAYRIGAPHYTSEAMQRKIQGTVVLDSTPDASATRPSMFW